MLEGRDDMGFLSAIKGKAGAVRDMLMPMEVDEVDEDIMLDANAVTAGIKPRTSVVSEEVYKVAGGESIRVGLPSDESGMTNRPMGARPHLKVHTNNVPKLKVQIYAPRNFDQVAVISDDLKAGKACVVNYERVENSEQRRICDFVNGTCYVLDGCAKRISDQIVLYVPRGVDVSEAMSVALTD